MFQPVVRTLWLRQVGGGSILVIVGASADAVRIAVGNNADTGASTNRSGVAKAGSPDFISFATALSDQTIVLSMGEIEFFMLRLRFVHLSNQEIFFHSRVEAKKNLKR